MPGRRRMGHAERLVSPILRTPHRLAIRNFGFSQSHHRIAGFGFNPTARSREFRFPAPFEKLPILSGRELVPNQLRSLWILGVPWVARSRNKQMSRIYPCGSGNGPQRRVRHRLPSPPLSLRRQGLSPPSKIDRKRSPRFRRVLGVGDFRIRTGKGLVRHRTVPQSSIVSVGDSVGSE